MAAAITNNSKKLSSVQFNAIKIGNKIEASGRAIGDANLNRVTAMGSATPETLSEMSGARVRTRGGKVSGR